nr:hypothetical protein [uncultured Ruegeria sp.]
MKDRKYTPPDLRIRNQIRSAQKLKCGIRVQSTSDYNMAEKIARDMGADIKIRLDLPPGNALPEND